MSIKAFIYSSTLYLYLSACGFCCQAQNSKQADIIIYGGTSAAVAAAVEASKNGNSVILVSPDRHLGGLSSGGLGWTDTGRKSSIGGLSRDFYHRVWKHYNQSDAWEWEARDEYDNGRDRPSIDDESQVMWVFEPHVAEQIFEDYITENNIEVFRDEWLDRENGVTKNESRITSIKTLNGNVYAGKIFIDATYEGDLMAASGVSYHVGREANSVYGEEWNGVQTGVLHHMHYFKSTISPYIVEEDAASGLLPKISGEDPGKYGEGDNKIQAYCYRVCMTDNPENRIAFSEPDNYDPSQYELLLRIFNNDWTDIYTYLSKFDPIPNLKTDTNNRGPFSSDNIGMNYDYPEASYERRKEIINEHRSYQMGLYWFSSTDPRVPLEVRDEIKKWGLAKDEFTDNNHWPHQLYVREARRMVGEYVTTEHDVLGKREPPSSVGMGSYGMDSHNIQRYVTPDGYVQNEGDVGVRAPTPYAISYGSIVPKKEECTNLLVPVCVSSSHIAYGSIRMEPVFMILGQSAAAAANIAIAQDVGVQDVPYEELKQSLMRKGQVMTLADIAE